MAQTIRPVSDVQAGNWAASVGNNIAATIDEAVQDDADYTYTTVGGGTGAIVALATATDPVSSNNHVVRYRALGNNSATLVATLLQTNNVIASWNETLVPPTFTNYARTLSGAQADAITDYSALRLKFEAAGGGIAEVGGGSQRAQVVNSGLDSYTIAFPANVTTGNLLIVVGNASDAAESPDPIVVTDTLGTSYSIFHSTGFGTGLTEILFIAYGIAPSSGANTVTVNPAGGAPTSFLSASIDEFSGVNATPLDVDGGGSFGTSTTPSDSITTVTNGAVIIGVMGHAITGSPTITANDGTLIGENENTTTTLGYSAIFLVTGTAGAHTIDWTVGASVEWGAYTAAFKPA